MTCDRVRKCLATGGLETPSGTKTTRLAGTFAIDPSTGWCITAIVVAVHLDPLHGTSAGAGTAPSIGSAGNAYDNAMAESIIGFCKPEFTCRQGP